MGRVTLEERFRAEFEPIDVQQLKTLKDLVDRVNARQVTVDRVAWLQGWRMDNTSGASNVRAPYALSRRTT